jgi:cardiolipin synthase
MFWTIVSACELAYLVAMIVVVILDKRSPISTIAWILAFVMLPYVGLAVYFFVGPHRIERKRMRHGRSTAVVRGHVEAQSKRDALDVSAPHRKQLAKLAVTASGSFISTAKSITILAGGKECFDAIEEAIRSAKHHVHVLYYIFEADRTGTRIRDALVERAKAGVKVRLLTDGVGTSLSRRFTKPMREAGVEIARFNPFALGRLFPRVQLRNHRKIVIVDGRIGFLGGINVGDEYDESVSKRDAFRDTHARVIGNAVRELQFTFLEDWHFSTNVILRDKGLFLDAAPGEKEAIIIVPSGPDQEWEAIKHVYFTAITQADELVQLTTPYFVPDDAMRVALSAAALRGVRVELIVPHRSDSLIVTAAARSYFDELLRAGVRVYEYPRMVHAKTMVVDGKVAIVGSANLDNRSFRLNFEISALFYDEAALARLTELFEADKHKCSHITMKSRSRIALPARLAEASARLLSPLL